VEPDTTHSSSTAEWIIIDGVRHVSYNMVLCLINNNTPCTVLVHPNDMHFAELRFPKSPLISIVAIDYANPIRPDGFNAIGANAKYLFMDPEDDCYETWHKTVLSITRNALYLAKKHNLTIFYPARIYPYGHPEANTITDDSYHQPNTSQGLTLSSVEHLLQLAGDNKECKIRKMRVSYTFGPAVYDYLLSSTFKDAPTLGRMTWLFRTDKPHQFCFAYDIARLALIIAEKKPDPYQLTIHFSGYTYHSVEAFGQMICRIAGKPLKQRTVSKFQLSLVCMIEPNAQRGSDLKDFFEQPTYLGDSDLLVNELKFTPTPPEEAIQQTLNWFSQNPNTRGVYKRL
jgi:nucleoside-diphosphate-sugar epimerase